MKRRPHRQKERRTVGPAVHVNRDLHPETLPKLKVTIGKVVWKMFDVGWEKERGPTKRKYPCIGPLLDTYKIWMDLSNKLKLISSWHFLCSYSNCFFLYLYQNTIKNVWQEKIGLIFFVNPDFQWRNLAVEDRPYMYSFFLIPFKLWAAWGNLSHCGIVCHRPGSLAAAPSGALTLSPISHSYWMIVQFSRDPFDRFPPQN